MVCESTNRPNQTPEERRAEVDAALRRLAAQITAGTAQVVIGQNGAVAFRGWQDNAGVTDVCAFRTLTQTNSWELRQAVARAEALAGRKVSALAVNGGVHSHDGGQTWHGGHS